MVTFWGVFISYINDNKMWIMSRYNKLGRHLDLLWVLVLVVYVIIAALASGCKVQPKEHHVITEDGVNWYSTEEYEDGYDTVEEPENIE